MQLSIHSCKNLILFKVISELENCLTHDAQIFREYKVCQAVSIYSVHLSMASFVIYANEAKPVNSIYMLIG